MMKKPGSWRAVAAGLCAAASLAACGGGGGGGDTSSSTNLYTSNLPQAGSSSTLRSQSLQQAFASNYLDAGTDRAQLLDAMAQDAAAIDANAGFSGFPAGTLSDVQIGNCDTSNVCTLSGTLTNADADTTSVAFSTQVVLDNGNFRVLGDQKSS